MSVSSQELDVRRSLGVIRRHRRVVLAIAVAGLLGGLVTAWLLPAMPTGKALVVLPPASTKSGGQSRAQDIDTQVLIANSAPVLTSAGQNVSPPLSTQVVKKRVKVEAVTQEIIEIRAKGSTPAQAKALANAVADTYVFYVTDEGARLPKDLGKRIGARVLERATTTSGGNMPLHMATLGLLGALGAGLAGALVVLVYARGDRRLRFRDDIADAVALPVLASLTAPSVKNASGWSALLESYQPSAVDGWGLRKTLRHLGLDTRGDARAVVTVVSFDGDLPALALGPQLAAFATALGMHVELEVEAPHEFAAPLATAVSGDIDHGRGELHVYVVVADRQKPTFAEAHESDVTLIAVTAGSVTAEELARLAVAAVDDGREVGGMLVANPDPADRTAGRHNRGRQTVGHPSTALGRAAKGAGR